jgi:hypothetical protein
MSALAAGIYLTMNGQQTAGLTAIITAIAAPAAALIFKRAPKG